MVSHSFRVKLNFESRWDSKSYSRSPPSSSSNSVRNRPDGFFDMVKKIAPRLYLPSSQPMTQAPSSKILSMILQRSSTRYLKKRQQRSRAKMENRCLLFEPALPWVKSDTSIESCLAWGLSGCSNCAESTCTSVSFPAAMHF